MQQPGTQHPGIQQQEGQGLPDKQQLGLQQIAAQEVSVTVTTGMMLSRRGGCNSQPLGRKAATGNSQLLPSFRFPKDADYDDPETFREKQAEQRSKNVVDCSGQKLMMVSHCWRGATTQVSKRMLISALGIYGLSYWADFLDLQSTGPVPWRKEIEEGIRDAAKMVLFIDKPYLSSFNCLQEVAFALHYKKPLVVIMLEQDAMELLTRPDGAYDAWSELYVFKGKLMTPGCGDGKPLTLTVVQELFETLSSVNFCMCRTLDFENDTKPVVLRRLIDFVTVELKYQKEHAVLQTKAIEWEQSGKDPSRLLNRGAIADWRGWITRANAHHQVPAPSALQENYVKHGEVRVNYYLRLLKVLVCLVLIIVTGLVIVMVIQWQDAGRQKGIANEQRDIAYQQREIATQQRKIADEKALVASTQLFLFHAQTDTTYDGYAQAAMREAMARIDDLPRSVQVKVMEQRTFMAQAAQIRSVGYPVGYLTAGNDAPEGYYGNGGASPDNRWLVYASVFGALDLYNLITMSLVASASIPGHVLFPIDWISNDAFVVFGYNVGTNPSFETMVSASVLILPDNKGGHHMRWELREQKINLKMAVIPGSMTQMVFSFSSDHSHAIFGFVESNKVVIVDVNRGILETVLLHAPWEQMGHVDWSKSGNHVAAGVGSNAYIWDIKAGTNKTIQLQSPCAEVFFSPDGKQLATRTSDGAMQVWNVADPPQGRRLNALSESPILGTFRPLAAWSPDGKRIAAFVTGELCLVQDLTKSGDEVELVVSTWNTEVWFLEWGPDSRRLFFYHSGNRVTVISIEEPESLDSVVLQGHSGDVISVRWNHDGSQLLSASPQDKTVRIFETATGSNRVLLSGQEFLSADWSPDGSRVAAIDKNGIITLCHADSSGAPETLGSHPLSSKSQNRVKEFELAWSREQNKIATVQVNDMLVVLWNPEQPESFQSISILPEGMPETVLSGCSAPSWGGDQVAVTCWELNIASERPDLVVALVNAHNLSVVRLSPRLDVPNQLGLYPLAYSPDGKSITVSFDGHINVWKRSLSGDWKYSKLGFAGLVTDIDWNVEGTKLITVSTDSRVLEWDLLSGCGLSPVAIARDLQGSDLHISAATRVDKAGHEQQVLAATDGYNIRVIGDVSSYTELINMQSRGVSREAVLMHYKIDEGNDSDAGKVVCSQ